jgi:tetratricopeptide (TPR) repeat protein
MANNTTAERSAPTDAGHKPNKLNVFVSYSRQDTKFVDRLQVALGSQGIEAFVDRRDIEKAEEWWARIKQLIGQADTIVFTLSPGSVDSKICNEEVEYAEKLNKRFVPIVARDLEGRTPPPALARLNYIFFIPNATAGASGDFDAALSELVRALETDIPWIREHTRLGVLAERWEARRRPKELLLRGAELIAAETWLTTRPSKAPDPTDLHRALITLSRGAATTRQRLTLVGSLFIAAIGFGLAGLAYWQRGIAQQQSIIAKTEAVRAERNFKSAQVALDGVVYEIAQGLQHVDGMRADTVRRILLQAEIAVDRLASATEKDDPEVRGIQGAMFAQFSDTYLKLGSLQLAAEYARKATEIYRTLSANDRSNTHWQDELTKTIQRVARALNAQGETDGALAAYRESLDLIRQLAAREPQNESFQSTLASSLGGIGDLLLERGEVEESLNNYREKFGIVGALSTTKPENVNLKQELARTGASIGRAEKRAGNLGEAESAFRQSLTMMRALRANDPANTEWQSGVAALLAAVGDVLQAEGRSEDALAAFRENLEIERALAAKDPGNTPWQTDLILALWRLAAVGDNSGARWTEALVILNQLKSQDRLTANQLQWIPTIEQELMQIGQARKQ